MGIPSGKRVRLQMERTVRIGLRALHGRLCGRCDIRRQVYWMVWQVTGNRYEGVDNVEYGTCGNQVLRLRHILCQHWQHRVNNLWWVRVAQWRLQGKKDGNTCESTNND